MMLANTSPISPKSAASSRLVRNENLNDHAAENPCSQHRYLILDRDPLYTRVFRQMLKDAGVNVMRLPARSPDLNSYAERWIRSLRSECLSRVIPLGERHLRNLISEYLAHYHGERNHQGLGNRLIEPLVANFNSGNSVVRRRERLGGVLNYYYGEAV
jgi:putative transposase